MKDIYELLNDASIDPNEFEEMEVTELEKAKLKISLKQSISKKKMPGWKTNVAVASIMLCLSGAALGSAFPAYASGIPVIGDIFKYLDNGKTGVYDNYKELSTAMNMKEESNGIKVTIYDAIFDGKTVSMTFSIESEKDLGENPTTQGNPKLEGAKGTSGLSTISKVGENRYVGLYQTTDVTDRTSDVVGITWDLSSIVNTDTKEESKGDWEFAFSLNATVSEALLSGQSAEQGGVKVSVEKISIAPMSFIVYYDQNVSEIVRSKWQGVDVELQIKDDLGNAYSGQINGGVGSDSYNISWNETFGKLDPNASKLIVTPRVMLRSDVKTMDNGSEGISLLTKLKKGTEEFALNDIVIELKK